MHEQNKGARRYTSEMLAPVVKEQKKTTRDNTLRGISQAWPNAKGDDRAKLLDAYEMITES